MKIRITEPTFFLGANRKVGDILDQVAVGPFRSEVIPGGLSRIPQFVEMPEEITASVHVAATEIGAVETVLPPAPSPIPPAPIEAPAKPANGSFAEATAAVLKPPAAVAAPANQTAALLTSLATRRRKLEQGIVKEAVDYGRELSALETDVPAVFVKAKESLADRKASLGELADSLKDFAGANDPLSE